MHVWCVSHPEIETKGNIMAVIDTVCISIILLLFCELTVWWYSLIILQEEESVENGYDLDGTLLRFSSVFILLYNIFTIITGAFSETKIDFPNEVHILNGVVEIVQVVMQIIFLNSLKQNVSRVWVLIMLLVLPNHVPGSKWMHLVDAELLQL